MRFGSGDSHPDLFSKVPLVTFTFWVIKILATTVGETGGDALSMTLKLGYAESSFIFFAFFVVTLTAQMLSKRYRPLFYWAVVVATTTFGTTTSDYLDRTLRSRVPVKSSIMLFCAVCAVLAIWHYCTGSIRVDHITSRPNEFSTGSQFWFPIPWAPRSAILLPPAQDWASNVEPWFFQA